MCRNALEVKVTVYRSLSCRMFWHVYAEIPKHEGKNDELTEYGRKYEYI